MAAEILPLIPLTFTVESDLDAARVEDVLCALGYYARRVVSAADFDARHENARAIQKLKRFYDLHEREVCALVQIVEGTQPVSLHELRKLKWVRRSLHAKLSVEDDAGLLRKVLAARATVGE